MTASTEKRRSVRITVLLITAIASLVFLSTGLVLFLSSKAAYRNTMDLLRDTASFTIQAVEDEVRGHVAPVEQIVAYVSGLVERGEIDPSDRGQLIAAMKGTLAGAPQVAGIVLWDHNLKELQILRRPDGTLAVAAERTIVDPGLLQGIELVKKTGRPTWRSPAHSQGTTYVYVAGPLVQDGKDWGVIVTGVSIGQLSKFVTTTGRQLDMTAFVLYGKESVLAHPSLDSGAADASFTDSRPLLPLTELNDPVVRLFHKTRPEDIPELTDVALREIEVDDEDYLVLSRVSTAFGDTPWHIGVYAPLDDLDDQINRLIASLSAGLGVLGLAIVAAVLLARYIARPIRTLSASTERIGRLELADIPVLPRSRIKELDDQAVAFNRMLDGLRWFETYVPKSLVSRLIAQGEDQAVHSSEMELTVLFTDIVGFTAMSEHMPPGDVADMLNSHFERVSQCIEAEGGTLDKYIGDSVMAFWGAPEHQPDHAERACRAALAITRAVDEMAATDTGHPPVRLKIAVHTGRLLVGNIGAQARMNYTVIGDTVNTCSRIEALCSQFDDGGMSVVLVSEDTADRARGDAGLSFEEVGAFTVRGRSEPVKVCRLTATS
ncbi:MAG: adenylate/guanylate cyclase domain-containing protein [Hyphomicrobiales bacterium]